MPTAVDDLRPSPDALLKAAEKESRGKHKIFLGAAPGVGKTWEMLSAAHRRLREGTDVVVGVVELVDAVVCVGCGATFGSWTSHCIAPSSDPTSASNIRAVPSFAELRS